MTNAAQYKMAACKFDYEYIGRSVKQLSDTYGYPENLLDKQIEDGEWERKLDRMVVPETKDLATFADNLREVSKAKLNVIALLGQIENQSMVAQLEKLCLDKALELAAELDPQDTKAATKLNTIVNTLNTLQQRNPVNLADNIKEMGDDTGKLVVNILNNVG